MAAPSDSPRQPAREFLARFGDRSFADALDLVTDDGRVQLVEAFPDEFQEDDLDAQARESIRDELDAAEERDD